MCVWMCIYRKAIHGKDNEKQNLAVGVNEKVNW